MSKARNPFETNGRKDERPKAVDGPGDRPPGTTTADDPAGPGRLGPATDGRVVGSDGREEEEGGVGWMAEAAAEAGRSEVRNDEDRGFYGEFNEPLDRDEDPAATAAAGFEWVVTVDEYGQILLEIPEENRRSDCFGDAGDVVQRSSGDDVVTSRGKDEVLDDLLLENDERNCGSVFDDACNQERNGMEHTGDDGKTPPPVGEIVSTNPSIDPPLGKLDLQDEQYKLESFDFLYGMKVDTQNLAQKNEDSVNCLTLPDSPDFEGAVLANVETKCTVPILSDPQTAPFLSFVSDSSEPKPLATHREFSVAGFEDESVVNGKLNTNQQETNQMPDKIEGNSSLHLPIKYPGTSDDISTVNLFPETLPFIQNGNDVEIIQQSTSANAETLKNCDVCVQSQASDPGVQLVDKAKENLEAGVLSLVTGVNISDTLRNAVSGEEVLPEKVEKMTNSDNGKNLVRMPLMILKRSTASTVDQKGVESLPKRMFVVKKSPVVSSSVTGTETNSIVESAEVGSSQTDMKRFVCSQEGCGWSFPTAYKLKRHEETHKGRKDFVCNVEGCNRKFTTIYNLKTHRKLHESPCTEVCPRPNCLETFRNKRLLDKHLKLHCDGEKTYRCPHPGCTKTFFSQTCVSSHARVHQHDPVLVCAFDGCGRKFDKLCRLRQHMRTHTGERPYRCTFEGCNWAFTTSSKLSRHLLMHNGQKKWRCPVPDCGRMFTRAEHVKGHMVTHSSQRPFPCTSNGCSARFKSKSSLEIHLKRYCQMGDKKNTIGFSLSCPHEECGQKCENRTHLKTHLERHNDGIDNHGPGSISISLPIDSLPMMINLELENLDNIVQNHLTSSSTFDHSLFLGQALPAVVCSTTVSALNCMTLPVLVAPESTSINPLSSSPAVVSGLGKTDYSNYLIDQKLKRKSRDLVDDHNISLSNIGQLDESAVLTEPQHSTSKQMAPNMVLSMDEIMTSHAITFRDPETGTIYVQTQLLQDDPPNTDMYLDDGDTDNDGITSDQPSVISAELNSMLHDDFSSDDDSDEVTFTATTINLQDLE